MNRAVVARLILKDWYLSRPLLTLIVAGQKRPTRMIRQMSATIRKHTMKGD